MEANLHNTMRHIMWQEHKGEVVTPQQKAPLLSSRKHNNKHYNKMWAEARQVHEYGQHTDNGQQHKRDTPAAVNSSPPRLLLTTIFAHMCKSKAP